MTAGSALLALPLLAQLYLPMLYEEHLTYTPDFYDPAIYAGQVEHNPRQRRATIRISIAGKLHRITLAVRYV